MLEICFSESVKSALSIAQHCEAGEKGAESISFIYDEISDDASFEKKTSFEEIMKKEREHCKDAIPLGGKREDIINLSFMLSEGDISDPTSENKKRDVLEVLCYNPWDEIENIEKRAEKRWNLAIRDLEKLKNDRDDIRLWIDKTPESICGLLFSCTYLTDLKRKVNVVYLPRKVEEDDGTFVEYMGWGEVDPTLYGKYLKFQQPLSNEEIISFAEKWEKLKKENSPLRVLKDGKATSAKLDYYDKFIEEQFPKGDSKLTISHIIGNILGTQKVPVGDVFIAKRIEHFIDNGELVVVNRHQKGLYSYEVKRA